MPNFEFFRKRKKIKLFVLLVYTTPILITIKASPPFNRPFNLFQRKRTLRSKGDITLKVPKYFSIDVMQEVLEVFFFLANIIKSLKKKSFLANIIRKILKVFFIKIGRQENDVIISCLIIPAILPQHPEYIYRLYDVIILLLILLMLLLQLTITLLHKVSEFFLSFREISEKYSFLIVTENWSIIRIDLEFDNYLAT